MLRDKVSAPNHSVVILICEPIIQKRALFQDETIAPWIVMCFRLSMNIIHLKIFDYYYSKIKFQKYKSWCLLQSVNVSWSAALAFHQMLHLGLGHSALCGPPLPDSVLPPPSPCCLFSLYDFQNSTPFRGPWIMFPFSILC